MIEGNYLVHVILNSSALYTLVSGGQLLNAMIMECKNKIRNIAALHKRYFFMGLVHSLLTSLTFLVVFFISSPVDWGRG
jgi:hypothetical protein